AIDWGFWQEPGMIEKAALSPGEVRRLKEEIEKEGLSNAGVEALHAILSSRFPPQVIVSPEKIGAAPTPPPDPGAAARDEKETTPAGPGREPVHPPLHPLFHEHVVDGPDQETWITRFSPEKFWVLNEHELMDKAVLPGTAYLEMARAAFEARAGNRTAEIREVHFLTPLILEKGEEKEVRTILKRAPEGWEFFIVSRAGENRWLQHAGGEARALPRAPVKQWDLQEIEAGCAGERIVIGEPTPGEAAAQFEARLNSYGPRWITLQWASFGANQALAKLKLPREYAGDLARYALHPALLDIAGGFFYVKESHGCLPFSYKRLKIHGPLPETIYSRITRLPGGPSGMRVYNVDVMDESGAALVEIEGYALREMEPAPPMQEPAPPMQEPAPPMQEPAPTRPRPPASEMDNFHLEIGHPGILDTLGFRPAPRRTPGPGEIEIEVRAAGLNFIEVLYALGMLPKPEGMEVKFGVECAGIIASAGEGVEMFKPGDQVMAFTPAGFSRYAVTPASSAALKPPRLSLAEAAAIPAVFTTAYYALITLARLREKERVLIHSAAGGVGMAAVTIARWAGAEIFATAGSPAKRAHLRGLGVRRVMDSRTGDFVRQVMEATGGRGVDVVLNSLGGEFTAGSVSTLARFGRFLELGKRDFFNDGKLDLRPFAKSLSYFAVDVGPDLPDFESIWREMVEHFYNGAFHPIPHRVFPAARTRQAFEFMAGAGHIGKIVISMENLSLADLPMEETLPREEPGLPLEQILGAPDPGDAPAAGAGAPAPGESEPATAPPPGEPGSAAAPPPGRERPELSSPYEAPGTALEKTITGIWEKLLGIRGIGIHDNFFDLRGDSLLAAQVVSRLYKAAGVKTPLSILFDAPTPAELARRVETIRQSAGGARALAENEEEGEI
ncbi:MAG: zinc-binding dehydrogenase, partial [Desulfobacterales bacterium]|nr:zinc-binding dehydrogenase [Desulfobacterales bacterium]